MNQTKTIRISNEEIAEDLTQYIKRAHLTMSKPCYGPQRTMEFRIEASIARYIEHILTKETGADCFIPSKNVLGALDTDSLFCDSLDDYADDQIKFDDIPNIVHDAFGGHWGIGVTVAPSKSQGNGWWDIKKAKFVSDPFGFGM